MIHAKAQIWRCCKLYVINSGYNRGIVKNISIFFGKRFIFPFGRQFHGAKFEIKVNLSIILKALELLGSYLLEFQFKWKSPTNFRTILLFIEIKKNLFFTILLRLNSIWRDLCLYEQFEIKAITGFFMEHNHKNSSWLFWIIQALSYWFRSWKWELPQSSSNV